MHNLHDQYAKDTLCALLSPAGPVKTEQEVSTDAQRVDLFFVPDASRAGALGPLGLLGRLAGRPCSLEHFHQSPSPAAVVACLRKHLNLCHTLAQSPEAVLSPMVWVLSSGRRAVAELRRLPSNALEVQVVLPIMLRYRLAVPADPGEQTSEDREFLMSTQDALGLWEQQVLQRGIR